MPFSQTIWMAAGLLWILDAGNNIAMEPYRAFVSDKLDEEQHSLGFLMQSFFTGLGSTLANFTPVILIGLGFFAMTDTFSNGIPVSTYWAFFIGAFASIASILYTVFTTKEYPPTAEELIALKVEKEKGNIISRTWNDIVAALKDMPLTMKQLIPVMFFTWYAMFCYWQYLTSALSISLYDTLDETTIGFKESQVLTGQVNGTYNIVCFMVAFALVPFARKVGAKGTHFFALLLGGMGLLAIPLLSNTDTLFTIPIAGGIIISSIYLFTIGLGIAWASMLAMPYQLLAGSIPKDRTGVYMGIFNLFIVIPMIIQVFTMQFFVYDLLGNNPVNVIRLVGVFLILGGIFTLFIKAKKPKEREEQFVVIESN
ncbi:MAG: maltose/moltooligosaccharide transporter [Saprospiraceae bacterium]|jgi:maltose/moltooligosaccharide transporter